MSKKTIYLLIIISSLFLSCDDNNLSRQGNWSKNDKDNFLSEKINFKVTGLKENDRDLLISAFLKKCELNYNSLEISKKDKEGNQILLRECINELKTSNTSIKGKWSDFDKESFWSEMETIEELNNFDENKSDFLKCYLYKLESNYSSFFSANNDEEGCSKLGVECSDEIVSNESFLKKSVLGNWSKKDKESFWSEMETIEELNNFGEKKSDFLECYLYKLENNYSSLFSANNDDEGCSKIAVECSDEIVSNESFIKKSVLGNWSRKDKESFWSAMENIDLSMLGESKFDYLKCYLNKLELEFTSYLSANLDEDKCGELALECNNKIFSKESNFGSDNGSFLGNWSEKDKKKFRSDMQKIDLRITSQQKFYLIECYLEKCEKNYGSFIECDADFEGCEKLVIECGKELNLN